MEEIKKSTLYIVPTPIGNLEDITFRAINILNGVDIIACEDTRHSLKLLNHYNIKKHLISYHSHNEKNSANGIIKLLSEGKSVALISDGGTPSISDPGFVIVKEALVNNFEIIALPGPTAFLPLLVASGFRTDIFHFYGFLSYKSGKRKNQMEKLKSLEGSIIFYESPHRIVKFLEDIKDVFPDNRIVVGRELTKINETIYRGKTNEVYEKVKNDKILGEYVIIIENY